MSRDRRLDTMWDMTSSAERQWPVPAALITLVLIPVAAGADRIGQLATNVPVTPANARFFAQPVPVVVHIISATVYCVLGAFQFVPSLRRRRWHRLAGRLIVPCGLAAALAGLWMTLFYQHPPKEDELLQGFRLVFGSGMFACIVLGFAAVRRRDIASHRAWMTRGYAIAVGAGTQALIQVPLVPFTGTLSGVANSLALLAGWVVNLAVAEWVIRRRLARPSATVTPARPVG
jgi:uncharacterized membrane protein